MSIAIYLENPKTPYNVGGVIRAASIFGASQVFWSGDRVHDNRDLASKSGRSMAKKKWRLPREERMKAYDIEWRQDDYALPKLIEHGFTPVCVELSATAESLPWFEHPEGDTVYVFGPEDGGVSKGTRTVCHRFVQIPGKHCLNLAASVNVTLYDRTAKQMMRSTDEFWKLSDAALMA